MEFTNAQKLIIALLTDIHAKLDIQNSLDADFVQRMVAQNHGWALSWKYPGLFEETEELPQNVKFVADVLEMWSFLEISVRALDDVGRQALADAAEPFGRHVEFPGFDGNNESEYLAIAHVFVDDLDRWSDFAGRIKNAHMRTTDGYERMLSVFEEIRSSKLDDADYGTLTVEELASILRERVHPSNR